MSQSQALKDDQSENRRNKAEFQDMLESATEEFYSGNEIVTGDTTAANYDVEDFSPEPDTTPDLVAANLPSKLVDAADRVSRGELIGLLEGFVRILKNDQEETVGPRQYKVDLASGQVRPVDSGVDAVVNDRTHEIEALRGLVIEAQDTIIKLLTDRVEDRAKIATLETQVKLLPDLQAQADRAMFVASKTEAYKNELDEIKVEVNRFRIFRIRSEAGRNSLVIKFMRWFLGGSGSSKTSKISKTPEVKASSETN